MEKDTDAGTDDRALVEAFLARRDDATFRLLYRRHAPAIHRFAMARLGEPESAEDVVQEAWIRAVAALPGFRWQSKLRTWLLGITLNCCRDVLRQRRRRVDRDPEVILESRPAAPISHPIGSVDLERAIAQLPSGYREVLILHDVENLTHEEISDLLGIRPGTSKSQLSRGRQAVRAWLTADGGRTHARRI